MENTTIKLRNNGGNDYEYRLYGRKYIWLLWKDYVMIYEEFKWIMHIESKNNRTAA